MGVALAEDTFSHNQLPWTVTVTVPGTYSDLTVPFVKPFTIAPVCTPEVVNRAVPVKVIAVSRNFVKVQGQFQTGDQLFLSCHQNVTRRAPPDTVYPQ